MNSRSHSRKKKPSLKLIHESQDFIVFATNRFVGKKLVEKYHIVLKREPKFSLERSVENGCDFIRRTSNNSLVGMIKNGELKRHEDVDKILFLDKLDLKPR